MNDLVITEESRAGSLFAADRAVILVLLWAVSVDCCLATETPAVTAESLADIYQTMLNFMAEENFERALPLAERLADLIPRVLPDKEPQHAVSLCNLALLQGHLGYLRESRGNFKHCISTYVKASGEYSPSLIEPLQHLSRVYFQEGDYTRSVGVLRRAQHIMHRTRGVYTLGQLAIVEDLSKSYVKAGRIDDADRQQRFYYAINEASYGENDSRMTPVRSKLGFWLKKSGQFSEALEVFLNNLSMISNESDVEVAGTLREIALLEYLAGRCCSLQTMQRRTRIAMNDPGTDSEEKIRALLELADMSLLNRQLGEAIVLYRQVWDLMNSSAQAKDKADEFFSAPILLGVSTRHDINHEFYRILGGKDARPKPGGTRHLTAMTGASPPIFGEAKAKDTSLIGAPLPLCANHVLGLDPKTDPADLTRYHLALDFSVDGFGQVSKIVVHDENVPVKLRRYVKRMLYITRFRPRLMDGEAVTAEHISLHQSFDRGPQSEWFADSTFDLGTLTVFRACREAVAL